MASQTNKPGMILQITLTNFVTHSYVEVFPGPNLNMILGANGSGKSTIVAGIILGLGGTPKIIGRGSKVSEYIKHTCNEAIINLKLQGDEENETVSIIRKINISDISTWYLNNKRVTMDQLKEVVSKYNIQVDNLCQFLPQDRVADFAKMNKQEVLKQTQIALCRQDLLDMQEDLISARAKHRKLLEEIENMTNQHEQLVDLNSRMDGRVKNLAQRKKWLKALDDIARKNMWLLYLSKADERQKVKEEREAAQKLLQTKIQQAKPIEQAIATENRKLSAVINTNESLKRDRNALKNRILSEQDMMSRKKDMLQEIKTELTRSLQALEDKMHEIASTEQRLLIFKTEREDVVKVVEKDNEERERLQKEAQQMDKLIEGLNGKLSQIRNQKTCKLHEIRSCQSQLESQERLITNRVNHLERIDSDTYKATMWLRQNKHLFRGQIFEPIMIEVNVTNQKCAMYVENSISFRDKIAFLCTDKDDVELLSQHLCTNQGLRINIVHQSLESQKPVARYPIEQLRRFGFNAYIDTMISAPAPIVTYLCRQFNLHNIPVAFNDVEIDATEVPVNVFFKSDERYDINVSHYTGKKSIKLSGISSDKSMSYCIDYEKMETLKGQIAELQSESETFNSQITAIDEQIQNIQKNRPALEIKMQGLRNNRQMLVNVDDKIKSFQHKLNQLKKQNENITKEKIEEHAREKSKRISAQITEKIELINQCISDFAKKQVEIALDSRKLTICRGRINQLEGESQDLRESVKRAEETLKKVRNSLNEITTDAKFLLAKAKEFSSGFTPDDDGFDQFRSEYEKLPSEIDALESAREEITARMQCLNNLADDAEMEEYDERTRKIEELAEKLGRYKSQLEVITEKMNEREKEWLEPLGVLVERINESFGRAFVSMGCAGEVRIFKENPRDYEKYGICISVTYRNGAPLQELNNVTQSGGERAVATAAYMLAMQELTPVPFRCVDEINQGMDENNERRIFDLLVDVTSQPNTSQYFFISPKLVKALNYTRTMKIHFVHNGPYLPTQSQWNETLAHV